MEIISGRYRVVFLGLAVEKETFAQKMSRLGVDQERVDEIISRSPIILKEGLGLDMARRYADAVQDAGGRVVIKEDGLSDGHKVIGQPLVITPFKDFTMCPECGHKQPKGRSCEKCGAKLDE